MRRGPHSHPCDRCHVRTECCGDVEQNYDGHPEWVCVEFDMDHQGEWYCEDCHTAMSTEGDSDNNDVDTEGAKVAGTPNI